jgi:hypothetical protein
MRSGTWDLRPPAAAGGRSGSICRLREHASAPPSPCTLCALSALAIHAAQGQPGRERRGWYPLGQLEEKLDAVARTGDQVVEVLHFMGGEDSPRRVLCPWRAHRLASTLPAVARATAVCFLRCECLRGRGAGLPRDPSHRWGARCSSGRDNLENRASVRHCGTCWEPVNALVVSLPPPRVQRSCVCVCRVQQL